MFLWGEWGAAPCPAAASAHGFDTALPAWSRPAFRNRGSRSAAACRYSAAGTTPSAWPIPCIPPPCKAAPHSWHASGLALAPCPCAVAYDASCIGFCSPPLDDRTPQRRRAIQTFSVAFARPPTAAPGVFVGSAPNTSRPPPRFRRNQGTRRCPCAAAVAALRLPPLPPFPKGLNGSPCISIRPCPWHIVCFGERTRRPQSGKAQNGRAST